MNQFSFKAVTSGELLFQFILRELYQVSSLTEIHGLGLLTVGGRSDFFSEYFLGINAMNMLARCVKKAERVRGIDNEASHQGNMVAYLQETLGMAKHDDESVDKLARLSLLAASDSKRKIKDSIKRSIRNGRNEVPCYLCGGMCQHNASDGAAGIEYEHIWPSSFGGNSIADNLLPACATCNREKKDMLLWHTGHLFSFVLKPDPSLDELTAITRKAKIAAQMRRVFARACSDEISLKSAAEILGPVDMMSIYAVDDRDAVDFSNFEFR
jgi:5-methylcytosine-specific restriction endonuclease McrA